MFSYNNNRSNISGVNYSCHTFYRNRLVNNIRVVSINISVFNLYNNPIDQNQYVAVISDPITANTRTRWMDDVILIVERWRHNQHETPLIGSRVRYPERCQQCIEPRRGLACTGSTPMTMNCASSYCIRSCESGFLTPATQGLIYLNLTVIPRVTVDIQGGA